MALDAREILDLPMIGADFQKSRSGKANVLFVAIDDVIKTERIAEFEIPESQVEQFAVKLEALSASIRALLHYEITSKAPSND